MQYGRFLEQHFFIQQAPPPDEESGVVEPGHVLKYSAYKNLASLAEKRGQWEKSIDAYLQVGACAFTHRRFASTKQHGDPQDQLEQLAK